MTLIWLSEGTRIFGGLSVRGAVKRKTERRTLNSTSLSPMDRGIMIYSIKTKIKTALKWNKYMDMQYLKSGQRNGRDSNISVHAEKAAVSVKVMTWL